MNDRSRWLEMRSPPRGGLDRLARALAQTPRASARESASRAWSRRRLAMASFAAACTFAVAVGIGVHLHDAPRRAFEQALHAALAQAERERTALPSPRELPSSRADVRILLVEPVSMPATTSGT